MALFLYCAFLCVLVLVSVLGTWKLYKQSDDIDLGRLFGHYHGAQAKAVRLKEKGNKRRAAAIAPHKHSQQQSHMQV